MKLLILLLTMTSSYAQNWTGVWGRDRSYLQFQTCGSEKPCDVLLKSYSSLQPDGRGCYGENLPLTLKSPTKAVGTRKDYGGCTMTFDLDASRKIVRATQAGEGCSSYCTAPYLADVYPFAHKELNLNDNFERCERSKAFRVWCASDELQKLDQAWEKNHDKLDSLRHENTTAAAWNSRDQMVAECAQAVDAADCIRKGYAKLGAEIEAAKPSANKVANARKQALNDTPTKPNAHFKNWIGTWSYSEESEEGDEYSGKLHVSKCAATGCHYSVINGNKRSSCSSEGEFKFSKAGAFDLQRPEDSPKAEVCRLEFTLKKNAIAVSSSGDCNFLCGVSGGGPDGTYSRKRR